MGNASGFGVNEEQIEMRRQVVSARARHVCRMYAFGSCWRVSCRTGWDRISRKVPARRHRATLGTTQRTSLILPTEKTTSKRSEPSRTLAALPGEILHHHLTGPLLGFLVATEYDGRDDLERGGCAHRRANNGDVKLS